jgi:diguanylate cyclase (GGDEF)-like protein
VTEPSVRPGARRGPAAFAVLAAIAIVVGVAAVVFDEAALAVVAALVALATAGAGVWTDLQRTRADASLWRARVEARHLARKLQEAEAREAEARAADRSPTGEPTDDWEIDPLSGLVRERHLAVVLQQVVAAARRKLQPVSVIFWELDGLQDAPDAARTEALNVLAAVAWRTMRESDTVFRLGDFVALGVLVDTAEPGAVVVADRVRESLRASPEGQWLTVSAGIACYPSHALDSLELVSCAGRALEDARARGHASDSVIVAASDQE